jgi:hypothetical protein
MRLAGHVAYLGKNRNAYTILVGKSEGRRSSVRDRHTWKDNIKIDLKDWVVLNWLPS